MPYFLVHTVVTIPADGDGRLGIAQLRERERERAEELQEAGDLVALWREAGRVASFGIWRGASAEKVGDLIRSLPMARFMETEVTELERHPNSMRPFPL